MAKKVDFKEISVYSGPERSPGFLLWHISTSWRSSIEAVLKPIGLTHPQFVVLASLGWLTRNGDQAIQAAIGKMVGLDPNTISQIIKGLEGKDLIKRESSLDSRAKSSFLTAKGKEILAKAMPAVEKEDTHFFSSLTKDELNDAIKIFQQLALIQK